jgi:hypothetical protein
MCKRVWTIPVSVGDGPFTVVDRGPDGDVPVEIIPRRVAAMAVVYLRTRRITQLQAACLAHKAPSTINKYLNAHDATCQPNERWLDEDGRISYDRWVCFIKSDEWKQRCRKVRRRRVSDSAAESDDDAVDRVGDLVLTNSRRKMGTTISRAADVADISPERAERILKDMCNRCEGEAYWLDDE